MKRFALIFAATALSAPLAHGQAIHGDQMEQVGSSTTSEAPAQPASTQAYIKAQHDMHQAMEIQYTGDADIDFAKGMIAHHQGAIDMAKVELEHGNDPEMRKLAEEIIEAQKQEIAKMQQFLEQKDAGESN